jgi:hypothetical protein
MNVGLHALCRDQLATTKALVPKLAGAKTQDCPPIRELKFFHLKNTFRVDLSLSLLKENISAAGMLK